MKIGNAKGSVSDTKNPAGPSNRAGYKGGRRVSAGSTTTAGGPGAKESDLKSARSAGLSHKHAFRSGSQDARDTNGPVSPSALQVKTRRRSSGSTMATPPAHGRE